MSSAELLVHVLPKTAAPMASPCIHCGTCVDHCPTRIHPAGLLEAAQRSDSELAGLSGVDSCIECGVCSYVCPSRLPLLAAIRTLRKS